MTSRGTERSAPKVFTIGHGTLESADLVSLLHGAGIGELIDIRSFPGSRRNPQFGRDEMARWLPDDDISYTWMRDLGGRRKPTPDSRHTSLRHPSFRAYADYMETPEFRVAVDDLLSEADRVVMCSESVWWRCHRRLLADHLVLVEDVPVVHLMHDGREVPHPITDGARRGDDGVIYDAVAADPSL
ncbi:DUF488 family protein [Aquihabitans daechungensis]|uniref:DUF488 domain-containing protein n=1 Tax=Aquihabitans daechungensis TaxID=1052257 RepID=UPI003B9FEBA5